MGEFQFKLLNKYLATNAFLYKIDVVSSPVCSLCEKEIKSLEHIFVHCNYTEEFGQKLLSGFALNLNVNINKNRGAIVTALFCYVINLYANVQLMKRDIVTAVIYCYITTEFL